MTTLLVSFSWKASGDGLLNRANNKKNRLVNDCYYITKNQKVQQCLRHPSSFIPTLLTFSSSTAILKVCNPFYLSQYRFINKSTLVQNAQS